MPTPYASGLTAAQLGLHLPFIHHRHRAKRTRAQPDSTTLLQVETGYDGNFRAPDLRRDQSSTLSLIATPTSRTELQVDVDFWASQLAQQQRSTRGRGDTHLTVHWTARKERSGQPALGVAYDIKLPTASPNALGTGRVDHRLLVPISFSVRRLDIDLAAGIDANGRRGGVNWGAEGGATVTCRILPAVATHLAWSGQTVDTDQPAGHYLSGGATWQITERLALDVGGRLGLSSNAPTYGLTAGVTVAAISP